MTTYTEGNRRLEVTLSEAEGTLSRETGTIISGQTLTAGTVLGKITTGTTATSAANAGNTGTGAMGAVTVSAGAKLGVHKLTIIHAATDAGTFELEGPDGIIVGEGTVGAAFSKVGLAFTLADATDFVVGDGFTITVAAGSGKYTLHNNAAADGSEVAYAVLLEDIDASGGDLPGLILARQAEVKGDLLTWKNGISGGNKTAGIAALATHNIIVR